MLIIIYFIINYCNFSVAKAKVYQWEKKNECDSVFGFFSFLLKSEVCGINGSQGHHKIMYDF